MNELIINILGFIFFYAFSYGICILIATKGSPRRCVGHIKINRILEILLLLPPCKYNKKTVLIYSLLHQMVLQYGAIRFIVMLIRDPSDPATALRAFAGVCMITLYISFFGGVICRTIYDMIHKNDAN